MKVFNQTVHKINCRSNICLSLNRSGHFSLSLSLSLSLQPVTPAPSNTAPAGDTNSLRRHHSTAAFITGILIFILYIFYSSSLKLITLEEICIAEGEL
jgi:hypothetical protein